MNDIKGNKNPRNVIVVLDDRSEWLEMHTKMLNRMPESESFEIVRFSDNKSASNFVKGDARAEIA